jgi:hypothetical protein
MINLLDRIKYIQDYGELNTWEEEFLESLITRLQCNNELTEKQMTKFEEIENNNE